MWPSVRLGDVVDYITVAIVGKLLPHYVEYGVPCFRSLNVRPHRVDTKDLLHISREYHESNLKSRVLPGDVLTVRTGEPGTSAVVPPEFNEANAADVIITRPGKSVDARWLSYYLNSTASHYVKAFTVGAVQQHFNVASIKSMTVELPSLPEQQAIAEVLGALDDKIAANRALITRSRELVQSVFARHANGLPFQPLSSVAEINANSIEPAAGKFRYIDISSVADGDYFQPTQLDWRDAPSRARRRVQFGDTIWSTVRPNLRAHALVLKDSQDLVASTGLATITARSGDFAFVFAATDTPGFADHLISNATGSAYPAVSAAALAAAPVPQFDQERNAAFEKSAAPLLLLSASATQESRTLASLRDTLLPALMSGRLRVRDAEKQVEEAL